MYDIELGPIFLKYTLDKQKKLKKTTVNIDMPIGMALILRTWKTGW